MEKNEKIEITERFVKRSLKAYDSGHDWWHTDRVRRTALYINNIEKCCDPFEVEIVSLLHDVADSKFSGNDRDNRIADLKKFLSGNGMEELQESVVDVINNISFSSSGKSVSPASPLLQIVQDADRLDAIGAIGVARAFNYGGFRNNPIYDPSGNTKSTISHFHDKLLRLKGLMNTETGKRLAEERHTYIESFLNRFMQEWNGEL